MKVLIIAAMDKEVNLLLNLLSNARDIKKENLSIYSGEIGPHEVYISKCGIGKVNSALRTQSLLQELKPDVVINSGVAGGAGSPIGSVIFADSVAYHDVWCGPGTIYGQADEIPLFMMSSTKIAEIAERHNIPKGLICSGDKFISTAEEIKYIRSHFPEVKGVDMESASIAQTCILNGTPFAIIRIISDTPGEGENISQYKDFWQTAPEKTFQAIKNILLDLK